MALSDTNLRMLVQNHMVRFCYVNGQKDFDVILDDEFSSNRVEIKYEGGQFKVQKFDQNDNPAVVLDQELTWIKMSSELKKLIYAFLDKQERPGEGTAITAKLSSVKRGDIVGQSPKLTSAIEFAKSEDMGFKYEIKGSISNADTKGKKRLNALDKTKRYTLVELVRELEIISRKTIKWLNSIPESEGTIDSFMNKIKADNFNQILITVTLSDDGAEKEASKAVSIK